ncbi:MAG: hypothetical protein ACTHN5_15705 [Phycisphaerae bacterium]
MRRKLSVLQLKPSGVPYAHVPADAMWDLVEYLSWQGVLAEYAYHNNDFTVAFPHLDVLHAQRILDEWDSAQDRPAAAEARPIDHPLHLA